MTIEYAIGPQGATGPKGDTGLQGPQGLTGPIGPAGPKGDTGVSGPAGPQGLTGPMGPAGPEGDTGAIGPQGIQGLTGPMGPAGPKGDTGAIGPQGIQGIQGPVGTTGSTGATGPAGPKGDVGDVGPQGIQGVKGDTGAQGIQGPAGPQGPAGTLTSADRTKLDGIEAGANNYVHPATHPASIIVQDASNRFVTDAEKTSWNAKVNATDNQTLSNKTLANVAFDGRYAEKVFTIADGASVNLSPENGTIQVWTLGANRSPTASNFNAGESMTLMVNDGSAFTITWPSVTWVNNAGSAPTLNLTGFTVIALWKVGTVLYGALVGNGS
jgi:hypothetical protein